MQVPIRSMTNANEPLYQCGILTWTDSDEPVQPPFKLRNSKWCSVSSLIVIEYLSDLQSDLSLCWLHIHVLYKVLEIFHLLIKNILIWRSCNQTNSNRDKYTMQYNVIQYNAMRCNRMQYSRSRD